MTQHVDLLIIGAGPAGMAAALVAAPTGISIALLDDNPLPGGQIWRDGPQAQLPGVASQVRAQLQRYTNIRLHSACKVVAIAGHRCLLLEDADTGWVLAYDTLIVCTGARELLLPFPGWTLPGITGAGALQALIKAGLPVAGERIVIAGSGPLLLAAAATARKNGAHVVRIAEQASLTAVGGFTARLWQWPSKMLQAVGLAHGTYRTSAHVLDASGSARLETVRLRIGSRTEKMVCDRLACGFGLVPNVEIATALGCRVEHGAIIVDPWQATSLADHYAAGECSGFGGSELALVEGRIAGLVAVGQWDQARKLWPERKHWQRFAHCLNRAFALGSALKNLAKPDTLVCRCEDVPYADLANHSNWNAAKLNTRCGMGACQGRICATAAQTLFGWEAPQLRPPFSPARIATLACLEESNSAV
ncbi:MULTISPECIES: NAD(P)/FAD-dependent oxidoreductase [unclassified Pseudomonas]|uniref:NAD(P)/FAD-dependent oxidoreductase n=1 Tax=unclassified Pseudomonas TaxID=196821 RepID=UPI0025F88961|nr:MULTISPECIES: FAD/NAD(P)-binding oxidoreductase [unclassified Pseudomonas]